MWLRVLSKDKMHIKKVPLGGTAYVMNWGESNYAIYKSYWYPFPSAVVDNERDAKRIMRAIFDGQGVYRVVALATIVCAIML